LPGSSILLRLSWGVRTDYLSCLPLSASLLNCIEYRGEKIEKQCFANFFGIFLKFLSKKEGFQKIYKELT
jgi:hypothetical protein